MPGRSLKKHERDYSDTPLSRKLGLKSGAQLLLLNAPTGFVDTLAPLPDGLEVIGDEASVPVDVAVVFCSDKRELEQGLAQAASNLNAAGGLWLAWPKKGAPIPTELNFTTVQAAGLRFGLVDNKSCSISKVHTALRFVVRIQDRPGWTGRSKESRSSSK